MESRKYYVYILSSLSGVLYVGITGDLERRVQEHKEASVDGFTKKYCYHQLVYYEEFQYIDRALEREKQLKNWNRGKKLKLIESLNPKWEDWGAEITGQ
ncbi:MAG: GIY-YIG nuclease family protein [Patescibacteria group bacterium]|jgi:putative endonuclease